MGGASPPPNPQKRAVAKNPQETIAVKVVRAVLRPDVSHELARLQSATRLRDLLHDTPAPVRAAAILFRVRRDSVKNAMREDSLIDGLRAEHWSTRCNAYKMLEGLLPAYPPEMIKGNIEDMNKDTRSITTRLVSYYVSR